MAGDIDEALRRIEKEASEKSGTLDLDNLGLSEIPKQAYKLIHLKELILGTFRSGFSYNINKIDMGDCIEELRVFKNLIHLKISNQLVSSLDGYDVFERLEKIDFSFTQVNDLRPLKYLSALQSLSCFNTQVSDLTPLKDLSALQSLDCYSTQVSDLTPLQDCLLYTSPSPRDRG